jgi:hypothetical protein
VKAVVGRKVTDYKRNEDEMHEFFSRPHVCWISCLNYSDIWIAQISNLRISYRQWMASTTSVFWDEPRRMLNSPWRWQLQCLPKQKTSMIRRCSSPKAEIVHWTPAAKAKGQGSVLIVVLLPADRGSPKPSFTYLL